MLIIDLFSLLPALTLAGFLGILLWPENIAYKVRLQLFMVILTIWVLASFLELAGFGNENKQFIYIINLVVGCFGLIGLIATYRFKPSREED